MRQGYTVFSIPVGVLYRPNAAKVKNLKAKDYLGKARLIAAADRQQSADHQWRPVIIDRGPLDDREGTSFAATNLVHQNLSSRTRQQSEPPLNRNVFPPTPPPDDRSTSNGSSSGSQGHHRSSSMRASRPPRLDLNRTGAALEQRRPAPQDTTSAEKPRIGTTRTASEPRGPSTRHANMRGFAQEPGRHWTREKSGHRRNLSDTIFPQDTERNQADSYSSFSSPTEQTSTGWNRGSRYRPPQLIDEEEEDNEDVRHGETFKNGPSELVEATPASAGASGIEQRRTRSPARVSRRANSRRPEVQRFRTKVHAPDDIRYIMIGPTIKFAEFETRIREKFGFQRPLKMKVQDDGDMITMVDQEDLDLLLSSAREIARREGSEMGKMEVSYQSNT